MHIGLMQTMQIPRRPQATAYELRLAIAHVPHTSSPRSAAQLALSILSFSASRSSAEAARTHGYSADAEAPRPWSAQSHWRKSSGDTAPPRGVLASSAAALSGSSAR